MVPQRSLARLVFSVLMCTAAVLVAKTAYADEIAPELETQELRQKARAALGELTARLSAHDRREVVGLYVAFDPTPTDAVAVAACDDDGDPVVALSDGLLRLVDTVARAQAYDEANGSRRVDDYASFLAASQVPGRRLLPAPVGFYSVDKPAEAHGARLAAALSFVIARELAHVRAGDVTCPHPTATREHGDDVWTAAEQEAARETARALYPASDARRAAERDTEAATRVIAAGHDVEGALAWLRFSTRLEAERPRVALSILATHPRSAARLEVVARAAATAAAASH